MTYNTRSEEQISVSRIKRSRPNWISFTCYGIWIGAFLAGVLAVFLVGFSGSEIEITIIGKATLFAVLAILLASTGIGLWHMKEWSVILLALSYGLVQAYNFMSSDNVLDILRNVLFIILFIYFDVAMVWRTVVVSNERNNQRNKS